MLSFTMTTQFKLGIVLFCAGLVTRVHGFTIGAPDAACSDMLPGHAHKPQTGVSPIKLSVAAASVKPGAILGLLLEGSKGNQFMGFIIQARDKANLKNQVGSFVAGEESKYMTCGRGIHNSLTHRSSDLKDNVTASWRAPSDFTGEVVFLYTSLTDYTTFWVQQMGDKVVVANTSIPQTTVRPLEEAPVTGSAGSQEDTTRKVTDFRPTPPAGVTVEATLNLNTQTNFKDNLNTQTNFKEEPVARQKEDSSVKRPSEDDLNRLPALFDDSLTQDLDYPQPSQKAEEPLNLAKEKEIDSVDTFTPIYLSSTTTLRTTTTAGEEQADPLPIVDNVLQHTDPRDSIFTGCNTTKACFGIPDNCVHDRKCIAIITYYPDKLQYHFEMKAKTSGYVSFGLSKDKRMGEDLTTNCIQQENGNVDIATGYNYGKEGNRPPKISRKEDGISERVSSGAKDGWISCNWRRNRSVIVENSIWDLEKNKYHVMLAVGPVLDSQLIIHSSKAISAEALGLGQVGVVAAKSRLYIILHGSFMIGAWVFAASVGIILSRYYKNTWTNWRMFGLDQWFIWHRLMMMLAWALSIVGLVLIIVDVEGLTPTIHKNPHGIMGFISVGLAFLQPFLALVRCNPLHPHRWLFNWVHWVIGNAAQLLGILCIFYAVDLDKAMLPGPETYYLLIAFVAFHFVYHFLLSCITCVADSKASNQVNLKYPPRGQYHTGYPSRLPYPDYEELKRDNPGSVLRIFCLFCYILINAAVTIALILLVVYAPTRGKLDEIGISGP